MNSNPQGVCNLILQYALLRKFCLKNPTFAHQPKKWAGRKTSHFSCRATRDWSKCTLDSNSMQSTTMLKRISADKQFTLQSILIGSLHYKVVSLQVVWMQRVCCLSGPHVCHLVTILLRVSCCDFAVQDLNVEFRRFALQL